MRDSPGRRRNRARSGFFIFSRAGGLSPPHLLPRSRASASVRNSLLYALAGALKMSGLLARLALEQEIKSLPSRALRAAFPFLIWPARARLATAAGKFNLVSLLGASARPHDQLGLASGFARQT